LTARTTGGEQPFKLNISASPDDWAPDGRTLLYHIGGTTPPTSLMQLPLNDAAGSVSSSMGEPPKPSAVVESRFIAVDGRFSPSGKWLAYVSTDSGVPEMSESHFGRL
jgi:Tol biopolymer transport system component